jgi:hypothetical protein
MIHIELSESTPNLSARVRALVAFLPSEAARGRSDGHGATFNSVRDCLTMFVRFQSGAACQIKICGVAVWVSRKLGIWGA